MSVPPRWTRPERHVAMKGLSGNGSGLSAQCLLQSACSVPSTTAQHHNLARGLSPNTPWNVRSDRVPGPRVTRLRRSCTPGCSWDAEAWRACVSFHCAERFSSPTTLEQADQTARTARRQNNYVEAETAQRDYDAARTKQHNLHLLAMDAQRCHASSYMPAPTHACALHASGHRT